MNLPVLRKVSIKDKLAAYMAKYEKLINYADQDVLNGAFNGDIGVLPAEYDVMTIAATYTYKEILKLRKPTNYYGEEESLTAVSNPKIIHYTTNMLTVRPWFSNTNHPLANEFQKYLEMSPWNKIELSEMKFDSQEAKIVGIVEKLPKTLSIIILGILHSKIKPMVRIKAKRG